MYQIRNYQKSDFETVFRIVETLNVYYPNIVEWFKKKESEFDGEKSFCKIAEIGENIAGIAIASFKSERILKISTFYINKEFQGKSAIGQALLRSLIEEGIKKKIRKIYVTFAEEIFDRLSGFFSMYGFMIEGTSPNRYIDGKNEIIMGKDFFYKEVKNNEFTEFIKKSLFLNRGFKIEEDKGTELVVSPLMLDKKIYKPSLRPRLNVKILKDIESLKDIEKDNKENKQLYISFYGVKQEDYSKLNILDAYDIESIFFPLELELEHQKSFIYSIEYPIFERFILNAKHKDFLPDKIKNRMENVIFSKNGFTKLRRGSRILFHIEDTKTIWGEAKICSYEKIKSSEAFNKYKNSIPFTKKKIQELSDNSSKFRTHPSLKEDQELVAIHIIWTKAYEKKTPLLKIPDIDQEYMKKSLYKLYTINNKTLNLIRELGNAK